MRISRQLRYCALVATVGLLFGAASGALAEPPAGAQAESAPSSSSDAPKSLPEGSVFSSVQQSYKETADLQVVRGHFDLGAPPNLHRYYCLVNIKTGNKARNGVVGELVPHADGTTGIKNMAVSLYSCADAQQQGLLVTTGYVWSGSAGDTAAPARQPKASPETPTPAPVSSAKLEAPPPGADTSSWAARAAAWESAFNAGNLKDVVALYAADGCRMPPNAPTVHGSEAILASLQAAKDRGLAKIRITVTSTESSGSVAYATGEFEVSGADGKHLDHGKWMGTSKKTNGKWKTQCDIWNSDLSVSANTAR